MNGIIWLNENTSRFARDYLEGRNMAVGIESTRGTRRIRFTSNVSHDGADYGPDYDDQECTLDARSAATYVREGRAVYIGDDSPPEKETFEEQPPKAVKGGRK